MTVAIPSEEKNLALKHYVPYVEMTSARIHEHGTVFGDCIIFLKTQMTSSRRRITLRLSSLYDVIIICCDRRVSGY